MVICMNKKLLFIGLVILAIFIIFIICNVVSSADKQVSDINLITEKPNILLKVDSSATQDSHVEYTLSKEDSSFLYSLVENIDYRNYTCDGIANYNFIANNNNYGIEVYENEFHIVSYNSPSTEAVISGENYNVLKQMLNKYMQSGTI